MVLVQIVKQQRNHNVSSFCLVNIFSVYYMWDWSKWTNAPVLYPVFLPLALKSFVTLTRTKWTNTQIED